jgi:hypothetical protein
LTGAFEQRSAFYIKGMKLFVRNTSDAEAAMKKILCSLALAMVFAGPAFAQTPQRAVPGAHSPPVMEGRKAIGHDPDPWIRNEILRHADSGWPD